MADLRKQADVAEATCGVETCERPVRARGWCYAHWHRWRTKGDVQADRPLRPRISNGASGTVCHVEGCDEPFFARRACKVHYSYLRTGTSFEELRPVRRPLRRQGEPCILDDCEGAVLARGLCQKHYWRVMRHGTTDAPPEPTEEEQAQRRAELRAYQRAWKAAEYQRDRERVLARRAVWLAANQERMKLHDARKRYKRRGLIAERYVPFTVDQLDAKMAYWGRRCWICNGPFEAVDHVKPLTKGGWHMLANLRPICRSCNSRKSNRWPFVLPEGA